MTSRIQKLSVALGALIGAALLFAQDGPGPDGGGGSPGGSTFATQYRTASSTFGGAGPGSAGEVLTSNGAAAAPTYQVAASVTPAALTRTSDTNVTLTLGGTPTTALLQATSLTLGWTGDLAFDRLTQGAALTVLANATNGTADFAALAAASDFQVLRRSGTALAFGSINLASTNAVTGTLPAGNGGLGITSTTDDTVPVGSGSAYVATALTSCSAATSAVTYNTTTNAWGCNTFSAGVTQSTGTFTINWSDACTTTPTQVWNFVLTGSAASLVATQDVTCTSDSTSMVSTAGDVPLALRPARTVSTYMARAVNAGATDSVPPCVEISTAGTMRVRRSTTTDPCAGGFTATGTKALFVLSDGTGGSNTFNYPLN